MKLLNLLKCILHICCIFSRKSGDQIHIDIIESKLTCEVEDLFYIFYRMFSSDKIQCLLLHCLWVDRDAGYRIFANHFELFSCDTVRSSGFNCKLKHMLQVKILPDCSKQTVKLICLECCRCSATDIYGIQRLSLHQLCRSLQFFDHCVKVTIDLIFPLSDW